MKSFLRSSPIMFTLGAVAAFAIPGPAEHLKSLLIPALFVMMTLSLIDARIPRGTRENWRAAILMTFLNFGVMSGFLLLSARLLPQQEFRISLIVLAAAPPAISNIALTKLLSGDTEKALFAETVCYLFALAATPLIMLLSIGRAVDTTMVLTILVELIILPFALSRLLRRYFLATDFSETINVLYAFGIYLGIALGWARLAGDYLPLILVGAIFIVQKFVLGGLFMQIAHRMRLPHSLRAPSLLFLGTKNGNMTLGICLSLFSPLTAIPLAVNAVLDTVYILWLSVLHPGQSIAERTIKA